MHEEARNEHSGVHSKLLPGFVPPKGGGMEIIMELMMGKQIGSGGTSDVYEWGNNEVVKIYKPHVPMDVIRNEMYIVEILNNFSLDIPRFIGSIDINGKKALIYERIKGNIMAEPLLKGYYKAELAYKFAQMHYDIHKKTVESLPSQYDDLKNRIIQLKDILGDKITSLLNLLDSIPIDNKLCHGDYQPLNIIGDTNKYVVIDWNGACSGNPVFDVAWSYMTLNSPVVKHLLGELISETFVNFTKDYIYYYCEISGIEASQILKCLPIVAARRLRDNNLCDNGTAKQEKEWLITMINSI